MLIPQETHEGVENKMKVQRQHRRKGRGLLWKALALLALIAALAVPTSVTTPTANTTWATLGHDSAVTSVGTEGISIGSATAPTKSLTGIPQATMMQLPQSVQLAFLAILLLAATGTALVPGTIASSLLRRFTRGGFAIGRKLVMLAPPHMRSLFVTKTPSRAETRKIPKYWGTARLAGSLT